MLVSVYNIMMQYLNTVSNNHPFKSNEGFFFFLAVLGLHCCGTLAFASCGVRASH